MTEKQIRKQQKIYGYDNWQKLIDAGSVWSMEGSAGRTAMQLLEYGVCFLPENESRDYYGSRIPSRDQLQDGSKGTLGNAGNFWEKVKAGEITVENDEYFSWM